MSSAYFVDESERSRHEIFPGVRIGTVAGDHLMLSYVDIDAGAVVEAHAHPHEQAGMVLAGRARFVVGDEDRVLGPGDMYRIPGGTTHRVEALDEPVVALDVFHPLRDDYL